LRSRQVLALFFAALTVAARLPFLVTGKIPFDSDEAVEGLMALHVLNGELPAFFWGQAFKGVPEVYASAGAFALFGSSVAILKGVTLMFFAAFVALNFVLLDKIASRWIAASASLLLVAAPPALVFWSLDGSAEYVLIMLLGTALLLLCPAVHLNADTAVRSDATLKASTIRPSRLFVIGLVVGMGLWVHQLFIVYLIPLAILLARRNEWPWLKNPGTLNRFALGLGAVAAIYLLLGVAAFVSGGFAVQIGTVAISATAPQKMARISIGILALAAIVQLASASTAPQARAALRRYWPLAAGALIGYLPVLLFTILVEPARSPARVANLRQLVAAAPNIFGNIVPILAGFKIATTERLPVPLIAVIPGAATLAAFLWFAHRRLTTDFFALFVVVFPALFLASGAYLDTQSYRYFIPWYAGLAVAWAVGSLRLAQIVRLKPDTTFNGTALASIIVAAIVGVHVWQQAIWYQKLQPDTQSPATVECLKQRGVRGGYAEYWTAYKLTFIAREEIIIAPTDGIDRYPRYTEYVRGLPAHERINVESVVCP
jgi:hypothetical protein